ncbi:equilibrative nucleoside transporter 3-like [Sitophilus oryzae]|uniref:Equilibrative nucleoside transporter 3-like n=1 Tax=Sitophilus oryzae TaxID=7048 RepID=A0A6J2YFS3_SITOR|nr:equilibrative nucleoside transporter 3-like [Sitophilus oryzae]
MRFSLNTRDDEEKPKYSLNYEDFPPFPPPSVAGALPPSRRGSRIPMDDIPGLPKIRLDDPNAPKDRFNFVFVTFTIFRTISVLPMVFFVTANEYWMYKFRTVDSNDTNAESRNYIQANYASFNLIASTSTGIICNFFSTFLAHKIRLTTRAYISLIFFSLNFVVQTVLAKVDTDSWQMGFFAVTMVIQVLIAVLMAIAGTGSVTIMSKFPDRYMKMFLFGQGIGGLVSALLRLVTITIMTETIPEALLYFSSGCVLMGTALIMFFFATKTPFFKFYMTSYKEDARKKVHSVSQIMDTIKLIWPIILLNFFNTVIPVTSITNLVVSEYHNTGSLWGDKYFITVMTFLLAACSDIVGRGLSTRYDELFSIPLLFVIVISKSILYGTIMMFTRAEPRHLPIIFGHDWQYGIILSTYHLLAGYLMNVLILQTFKFVPKEKYEIALMVSFMFMGVFMGITSLLGLVMVGLL